MVYWAAVFIMTRRLTRYENRENLAEGVGLELGHRSRQARALNKKDQASRLSSISSILLNHPVWGRNVGKMWARGAVSAMYGLCDPSRHR